MVIDFQIFDLMWS